MKCYLCHTPMETGHVWGIRLFAGNSEYSMLVHQYCLDAIIGPGNVRKLRVRVVDSGWAQLRLPLDA